MSDTTTTSRVPAGVPTGGQFAASAKSESGISLSGPAEDTLESQVRDDLAPALAMNRVEAENHVRSLLDAAAADGDAERVEQIATLASGLGWKGVAYVRNYPGVGNPESQPTDYLPTKAAATRTAEHAWAKTIEAERNAAAQEAAQENSTDEWLPPGAHQIVVCQHCDADPACRFCDNGNVTTDRYGQRPWYPDAPGTEVAFEVRRGDTAGWHTATVIESTDARHLRTPDFAPNYALAVPADGTEAREIGLRTMLPVGAADAAARHGVSRPEMIAEAAHDMHIGIDPTEAEVLAFLDRIDSGYHEDLASAAARHRTYAAAELREEGKTGPALDVDFDTSVLPAGAIDYAIKGAQEGFRSQFEVTGREHWHGYTLVATPSGRVAVYNDTAWEKPEEQPLLPWSPPTGTPVAHVALDGTVRRIDRATSL